jgi:hypothetical protein
MTMSEKMRRLFNSKRAGCHSVKFWDNFGGELGFTHHGSDKYKTKYGFVISLIFYITVCLAMIYYFLKWSDSESPTIQWNSFNPLETPKLGLTQTEFGFAILPYDKHRKSPIPINKFLNSFSLTARAIETKLELDDTSGIISTKTKSIQEIKLVPCSKTEWFNRLLAHEIKNETQIMIRNFGICLDWSQPIKIHGSFGDTSQSFMSLELTYCSGLRENSSDPPCDYSMKADDISVHIGILNNSFDLTNYDAPFRRNFEMLQIIHPTKTVSYQTNMFIKPIEIATDRG